MKIETEELDVFKEHYVLIKQGNLEVEVYFKGDLRRCLWLLKRWHSLGDLVDLILSKGEELDPFPSVAVTQGDRFYLLNTIENGKPDVVVGDGNCYIRIIAPRNLSIFGLYSVLMRIAKEKGWW